MFPSRPAKSFKRVFENIAPGRPGDGTVRKVSFRESVPPSPAGGAVAGESVLAITQAAALEYYVSNMNPERPGPVEPPPAEAMARAVEDVLMLTRPRSFKSRDLDDLKKLRRELAREYHPDRNRDMDPRIMMLANSRIDALVAAATRKKSR